MASVDLELHPEDEQLLGGASAPAPRWRGRALPLALAAGALGAVLAWRGAAQGGPAAALASSEAAPQELVKGKLGDFARLYAKLRELTEQPPTQDPLLSEVSGLACEAEEELLDICGDAEGALDTACSEQCIAGCRTLEATCPPGHDKASKAREQLKACGHELMAPDMRRGSKAEEKVWEEFQQEIAPDETASKEMECIPYMLQMAAVCELDLSSDKPPDFEVMCKEGCQDSIKQIKDNCAPEILKDAPLDVFQEACGSDCTSTFLNLFGQMDGPIIEDCELFTRDHPLTTGDLPACSDKCHPHVCELQAKCQPGGKPPNIPGVDDAKLKAMDKAIKKALARDKCSC